MSYAHRLAEKSKHNSPVRLVFDGLRRIGFAFIPYYLMRETASGTAAGLSAANISAANTITFKRLSREEINALPRAELAYLTDDWLQRRMGQGDFCLALMLGVEQSQDEPDSHSPTVAAICWATRNEAILVFESVELHAHEAYIYAAHTFSEHRGKGLMPLLRIELCRQLDAEGATDMYSLVDSLNRPACNVYNKMSASKVQSGVAFSLFGVLNSRVSFKNYEPEFADR